MEELLKKQMFYTKIMMGVLIGIFSLLVFSALAIIPKTVAALNQAEKTLEQTYTTMETAENTLLEVTGRMAEIDNVLAASQDSMSSAMEKIEAFDVETLNAAIKQLETIVKPMAKLMGYK